MGDLLIYISSEQGGRLIICNDLYVLYISVLYLHKNFGAEEGGLIIHHGFIIRTIRYQGRIEPPKAARGHATSNSANVDSIVLNVIKDRGPCAACKTAHTIEVLISILYT